jgi:hypothetical protein
MKNCTAIALAIITGAAVYLAVKEPKATSDLLGLIVDKQPWTKDSDNNAGY